jgi:hypothetical protein
MWGSRSVTTTPLFMILILEGLRTWRVVVRDHKRRRRVMAGRVDPVKGETSALEVPSSEMEVMLPVCSSMTGGT